MTSLNLWDPVVPINDQHPNFQSIARERGFKDERRVISSWAEGFVDRDGKFVREFQTTFNSSFWELYLHATFRQLGCVVNFRYQTPDFVITHPQSFVAEAVTALHPTGYSPEWNLPPTQLSQVDFVRLLALSSVRLSNAISSKLEKYRSQYAKLAHVEGKPFVVCVAPFEQPYFYLQNDNAIRRVLYGYDEALWYDDPKTGERVVVGHSFKSEVQKQSGSRVPLAYFTDNRAEEISAVVFSNTATFGKVRALARRGRSPVMFEAFRYNAFGTQRTHIVAARKDYKESLLDGLHICVNPFARVRLDLSLFHGREVSFHYYDPRSGQYYPEAPDGFLIQRSSASFRLTKHPRKGRERKKHPEYTTPELEPWKEGELVPMNGYVSAFVENHMGHYRGWTVVVAKDEVDGDWLTQAAHGVARTLQEYIRLNAQDQIESLIAKGTYPSREKAFTAIKKLINTKVKRGG